MLTVKTYLHPSPLHGIGLFAAELIEKGSVLWKATPHTFVKHSFERVEEMKRELSVESFAQINKYWVRYEDGYYLCIDDARFVNHSHERANTLFDPVARVLYAAQAIEAGEEILEDYDECYPQEGEHAYV